MAVTGLRLDRVARALAGSSSQALIKLAIALLVVKVVAAGAGPEGLARFGQFQTLIAVVVALTTAPWTSAVIRLVAAVRSDPEQRAGLSRTLLASIGSGAALTAALLWIFAEAIAQHVFDDANGTVPVRLLAIFTPLSAAGGMALAYSTGAGEIGRVVRVQIVGHIVNGAGCLAGYEIGGMVGAVLGLTAAVGANGLLNVFALSGESRHWLLQGIRPGAGLHPEQKRLLSHMALVALLCSLAGPGTDYLLRQHIAAVSSWDDAGYWQALNKLSEAYLFAITAVFGTFYLPALGHARSVTDLRRVMGGTALVLMPVVVLSAAVIYLLRHFIVGFALSPQFEAVTTLVGVQLLADVLRVTSVLFGYLLLAKASPTLYAVTECGFSVIYLLIGLVLIPHYGWSGAVYAYVAAHVVYLVYTLPLVMRLLRSPCAIRAS